MQSLAAPYDNAAEAHYAIAVAALNTGLTDMTTSALAMKEVDRALSLNPAWDRAIVLKAEIMARQDASSGIALLRSFVADHPHSRRAAGALAQLYVQEKQYPQARHLVWGYRTAREWSERVRLGLESRPGCRLVESQEPRLWVAMARLHSAAAGAATRSWCS